jgi:hypothetical protein
VEYGSRYLLRDRDSIYGDSFRRQVSTTENKGCSYGTSINLAKSLCRAPEWVESTPEDWATDTLQVAKKAYRLPETQSVIQSGTAFGESYFLMSLPLI